MPHHTERRAAYLRPALAFGPALARACLAFLLAVALAETALRAAGVPRAVGFAPIAAAFLIGGVASGLLHERLMRPARSRTDALAAGAASALPLLLVMRVAARGVGPWTLAEAAQIALLALFVGAVSSGWRARGQLPIR